MQFVKVLTLKTKRFYVLMIEKM